MGSDAISPHVMLDAIEREVRDGISYLQAKNEYFTADFFKLGCEWIGSCKIQGTLGCPEVTRLIQLKKPHLLLCDCDVSSFRPGQELYLSGFEVLGTITAIDELEETCELA